MTSIAKKLHGDPGSSLINENSLIENAQKHGWALEVAEKEIARKHAAADLTGIKAAVEEAEATGAAPAGTSAKLDAAIKYVDELKGATAGKAEEPDVEYRASVF